MTDWSEPCRHCGVLLVRGAVVQTPRGVTQWAYGSASSGDRRCYEPNSHGLVPMRDKVGTPRHHRPFMPDLKDPSAVMSWLSPNDA